MSEIQFEPLTPQKATQISVALNRFREIGANKIINPRDEAELTGLRNFFSQVMIDHGSEFMGCFIAVRNEYEPLIQIIDHVTTRIQGIRQSRALQQAAAEQNKAAAAK
jgi:hypothetical protein